MTTSAPCAFLVGESGGVRALGTPSELREVAAGAGFFWLDVCTPDEAVRAELLAQLDLPEADVAWAQRFGQAPRLAVGRHGLLATTWLWSKGPPAGLAEIHLLSSSRLVLTVWSGAPSALDEARQHFAERASELAKSHFAAAAIVLQLLLASLDQAILSIDTRLDEVRDQLRRSGTIRDLAAVVAQVQKLHTRWTDFDRYSSAVRSAMVGVEAIPGIDARGAAELNDYTEQVADTEHRLHERDAWAAGVLQNYAATLAQHQSDQISRLTLVSIIFLPLTFLTGFFGMNFTWMSDALGSATAFLVLGVLLPAVCTLLTIVWLHRRRLI